MTTNRVSKQVIPMRLKIKFFDNLFHLLLIGLEIVVDLKIKAPMKIGFNLIGSRGKNQLK